MEKLMIAVGAALTGAVLLSGPAAAQGTAQTVDVARVNVQLPAGYRASKVIESEVLNDGNQAIGKVDDLLVSTDGKPPYTVLSIVVSSVWIVAWLLSLATV